MIKPSNASAWLAAILVFAVVLSGISSVAGAQTSVTSFTSADKFAIPGTNGTINFGTSGTYTNASLVDNTWNFLGLRLNNSQRPELLVLKVAAVDSRVTIRIYQITSTTLLGGIRLRYNVTGQGTQSFNFGFIPQGGEWDIVINGQAKAQNEGWNISPDATITITGATGVVSITYYSLPADYVAMVNQPFYEQHSVAIATAIAVTITVIIAVMIQIRNRNPEQNETGTINKPAETAET